MNSGSNGRSLDIGHVLDTGPWPAMQKAIVLLAAFAVVLDGFDGQLIGFAIPVMMRDWGLPRGAFTPVVAAGLFGMGFGSLSAGFIGDRLGRRTAIIGSVMLFGVMTCLIGFSQNIPMLASLRFLAGLGIGGALPSATTMAAEYTPLRRRTLAVTATIVCVPLGGMFAGLYAGWVLTGLGWRALFFLGGALPLALGLLLVAALPESARFLVRRPERWDELRRLMARLSRPVPADTVFTDAVEQKLESRGGVAALFTRGLARDTVLISVSFFLCLMAVYTAFSWLPTMLSAEGLDTRVAGSGLTVYNLGGVIGALIFAVAISRIGSRWPLAICCLGGALSAFALQHVQIRNTTVFLVGLGLHGLFVNAVQSTLYALCAYIYPTRVRATGTAVGLSIGRLGAILSAFVGAGVITSGGAGAFLNVLGWAMAGVFVSLLLLRRHIPARRPGDA